MIIYAQNQQTFSWGKLAGMNNFINMNKKSLTESWGALQRVLTRSRLLMLVVWSIKNVWSHVRQVADCRISCLVLNGHSINWCIAEITRKPTDRWQTQQIFLFTLLTDRVVQVRPSGIPPFPTPDPRKGNSNSSYRNGSVVINTHTIPWNCITCI